MLREKNILVGVTGSIAAYKSALLIRGLVKQGAHVKVVMTQAATDFISPLTLSTLSKNQVHLEFVDQSQLWTSHVELGLWADLMVVAPATANTLSKFALGACDNLLIAVYLSARCPVMIAPAMDLDMYHHPSTRTNLDTLKNYGNIILEAPQGELASGLVGEGRMAEPETIISDVKKFFQSAATLTGKKALVTAGPTYEAIDPVRFIGNHSSGKMGYAIAEALATHGASVTLVSGPCHQKATHPKIKKIDVTSAAEMYEVCQDVFEQSDIIVLSAAVADYKPDQVASQKIKKHEKSMNLTLSKTVDIAASLGAYKKEEQIFIGFALETENELSNALEKIKKKNFDLIVLNSLNDAGAGFGTDTNKITILDKTGSQKSFKLKSKKKVAEDIVREIEDKLNV